MANYLPITRLSIDNDQKLFHEALFDETVTYFAELLLSTFNDKQIRKFISNHLNLVFSELTENIRQHSEAKNLWCLIQRYDKSKELYFCLLDDGIGIRNRFSNAGMIYNSDEEALRRAIAGDSAKVTDFTLPGDQGHGLGTTINLISKSPFQGSIVIQSGDAIYSSSYEKKQAIFAKNYDWQGVLIAGKIKFPEENFEYFNFIK